MSETESHGPRTSLGHARAAAEHGNAAVTIALHPSAVLGDERPTVTLTNVGNVPLIHGVGYALERYDGSGWEDVPLDAAPVAMGFRLNPGQRTRAERVDDPEAGLTPGLYRVTKYMLGGRRAPLARLSPRAQFEVRGAADQQSRAQSREPATHAVRIGIGRGSATSDVSVWGHCVKRLSAAHMSGSRCSCRQGLSAGIRVFPSSSAGLDHR